MSVDFFVSPCSKVTGNCRKDGVVCKATTRAKRFGVSDKKSELKEPAFIDVSDESIWELTIENPSEKGITFKAIDFCVDVRRENNKLIKRCEGFLIYDNKLVFIELKSGVRGWLADAREKFEETIEKFREHHPDTPFEIMKPVVSNKMFPRVPQNEMIEKKKLKDKIGLEFLVTTSITIE